MNTQSSTIVQRVWHYCNVLRDDGISYGDYVQQRLSAVEGARVKESRLCPALLKSAFQEDCNNQ